jgi:hypothetical protein
MARLWRDQGKQDEARELLAPVYGWFTEGFDTLDVKEAKKLLRSWRRDRFDGAATLTGCLFRSLRRLPRRYDEVDKS